MGAVPIGFPLISIQLATTPGDVLYTCPANTRARLDKLTFLNTTGTGRTVTAHLVRFGDTIADKNQIISATPIPAEGTVPVGIEAYVPEGLVLNPGDFIQAFASAATAITPFGSVTEFF